MEAPLIVEEGTYAYASEDDDGAQLVEEKSRVCLGKTRFFVALRYTCVTLSVVTNALLVCVVYILMKTNASYTPIKPPKPANDTKYYCPFTNGNTDYPSAIALTEVSADYVSLCWRDIIADDRGRTPTPYTLKVDDFWNSIEISKAEPIYRGRSLHFNATDLLPAVTYRFQLTAAKNPKDLYTIKATTSERGYCGNLADITAQKKNQKRMKSNIQQCIIKNVFSDNGARDCIVKKVGLSPKCASCWVKEGHCTLKRCATKCLNPASQACKDCSEKACFPDCVVCSGLPRWTFPA